MELLERALITVVGALFICTRAFAELPAERNLAEDYAQERLYAGNLVEFHSDRYHSIPCSTTVRAWVEYLGRERPLGEATPMNLDSDVYRAHPGTEAIVVEPSDTAPRLKLWSGDNEGVICFTGREFVVRKNWYPGHR